MSWLVYGAALVLMLATLIVIMPLFYKSQKVNEAEKERDFSDFGTKKLNINSEAEES